MSNSPVQKIKERLSIEEVVSSYIKLERIGNNLKARCPFHEEKTPSFFVSPERGSYFCFGCSAKGDIFSFVEEFEGLDFKGALKLLAGKAGVPLESYNPRERENQSEKDRLYLAMEEATLFFEENLSKNKEALAYLKSRGVEEKSIKDFRIGYALNDWRTLYFHLQKKGFSDAEIEKAGLAKKSEKGMYDRFRSRVMFPIGDSSGRIIAFSGRIFPDDPSTSSGQVISQAKYLNSPETPIFYKSSVLYGLDKAKESIRKNNFSILVEGQMDLVLSHQAGFKNTVATSGTALSDSTISKENVVSNLGLIRRLSNNIVLAFDADKAGLNAASRAGRIALSLGMDVKAARMPEGVDPADLIAKDGVDAWRQAIRESKHIIEFKLHKLLENSKDERKLGREIKDEILPFVNALASSIEKSHFLKKISSLSQIKESALEEDLNNIEQELRSEKKEIEEKVESEAEKYRKDPILRRLLGIIFWQRALPKPVVDVEKILKEINNVTGATEEDLKRHIKESEEELIFRAEVFYKEGQGLERDVGELLSNLEEEYLKEELSRKMRELSEAEEKKDTTRSAEILKECKEINDKIQNIKSRNLKQAK